MADGVLRVNVANAESLAAGTFKKQAYFFDTFANALAALDDGVTDIETASGIQTPKVVDRLTNVIGAAQSVKGVEIDENGDVVTSLDNAADKYMIIPFSGLGVDPKFIPLEHIV